MARLFELGHSYRRSYPTEERYTVPFAQRRRRRRMTWGVGFMVVGDWCSEVLPFLRRKIDGMEFTDFRKV